MPTPGDVVLALFYYSDYRGAKVRPCVVVSSQAFTEQTGQIIICAVSSKPPRNQFEVSLQGWQDAGLRFPSKVQAGKLLTVDAVWSRSSAT